MVERGAFNHDQVKHAAEAAAVIGALVFGAGAAMRRRKHHSELRTFDNDTDDYERRVSVFTNPEIPEQTRQDMANAAVRIHHATIDSQAGLLVVSVLRHDLGLNYRRMRAALQHLRASKHEPGHLQLIEHHTNEDHRHLKGYRSTPILAWALEVADIPILQQAEADLLIENVSNDTYGYEDTPAVESEAE